MNAYKIYSVPLFLLFALLAPLCCKADNASDYDRAYKQYEAKDYASCLPTFIRLSDAGYCDAHGYAGLLYELGYGTDKNRDLAYKYYKRAYGCREPWWSFRAAKMLYKDERFIEAYEYLNMIYDNFPNVYYRPEVAYYLAAIGQSGIAGPVPKSKVIALYREAAKSSQHEDYAKNARSCLEELGVGVYDLADFKDPTPSMMMGKSGKALYDEGYKLYQGFGTDTKDLAKAYTCFMASARKGYAKGWEYLGYLYKDKSLPIYDLEKSKEAFLSAHKIWITNLKTDKNDKEAAYGLGSFYLDGKGVAKSDSIAALFFVIGAYAGDSGCQLKAGITLDKLGNYAESLYWLEECGRHGQGWGAYAAGKIYEEGRNGTGENYIPANRDLAIEMYRASAKTSNAKSYDAKRALSRLGVSVEGPVGAENTRKMPAITYLASLDDDTAEPNDSHASGGLLTSNNIIIETTQSVDLGLKSGTLWASCNLNATSPEQYGSYFSWGETSPQLTFDRYVAADSCFMGDNIAGTMVDAATVILGRNWAMPTHEQAMELLFDCDWTFCSLEGNKGFAITGPNGKSIFLPAGGSFFRNTSPYQPSKVDDTCFYWTAEKDSRMDRALALIMSDGYPKFRNRNGDYADGKLIRPVVYLSPTQNTDDDTVKKKHKR